jgi:hypothetical protein
MLFEPRKGWRRLYRRGDPFDPQRKEGKTAPDLTELPNEYRGLLEWYQNTYAQTAGLPETDPLLALRGIGREVWAAEDADEYVRRLREGWS